MCPRQYWTRWFYNVLPGDIATPQNLTAEEFGAMINMDSELQVTGEYTDGEFLKAVVGTVQTHAEERDEEKWAKDVPSLQEQLHTVEAFRRVYGNFAVTI